MDLLTTYTQHSELQVITALSLISKFYKSPQHPPSLLPACCVLISHSQATASNSGDSSASHTQVLSLQPPMQNSQSAHCQLNYSTIYSQSSLQNWTLNCQPSIDWIAPFAFFIAPWHGPHWKHHSSSVVCVFVSAGTCLPSCWLEMTFCLFAYCIAMAVHVWFEVFA
jgi:hypothetical protein